VTGPIRYFAPMGQMYEIPDNSVDLIISQAVMEHVDELEETYTECFRCLKPGGYMTHQIDLRCHDTAPEWNGHWKYPDLIWRLMRGGLPWFINRQPCSAHNSMVSQAGFKVRAELRIFAYSDISRGQLTTRFEKLSESDLTTAGVLILASKSS
jgi:ubiquinone/menaquinone biosynthesis C-methylase UbiE